MALKLSDKQIKKIGELCQASQKAYDNWDFTKLNSYVQEMLRATEKTGRVSGAYLALQAAIDLFQKQIKRYSKERKDENEIFKFGKTMVVGELEQLTKLVKQTMDKLKE